MNQQQSLFHFDDGRLAFDDLGHENGFRYWWASDLRHALGYESEPPFHKALNRAMSTCAALNINIIENFVQQEREIDGRRVADYRLSRFACYLVAMNADPRKPQVASAQAYFATLAEAFARYVEEAEDVERVLIRDDVSEREKLLHGAAKRAGVDNYAYFQSAGYRGLYNMNLKKLRALKGVPGKRSPLDFMGKTELAANLFRITQTEEKLKADGIQGQRNAERTAESVGRKVRQTMIEISGTPPERLPSKADINEVRKSLKSTHRDLKKLDKPR
ncbi:damage-inducible protein D [Marichromatium gracile]|uniref:DNA-damage-inducible protein D n=1 Tax=Marichromatium gracile TaxID=1048 RepID=A0A4V2W913_MARGR|nr:damage-inducible protein D [Marichromatium gracile]MBK1709797.1 damage-inducible protein D [Marichromatium gracile]TCW32691.1 DNA-damage-inducible protein D [Marichromatium gracile]